MCMRAAPFLAWDVRSHFCTLFETKQPEKAIFVLIKIYFRISYPVLEHPFLLQHLSFCFRTFFSALELLFLFQNVLFCFRTPKIFEKLLKKMLIYKRCGCEVRPLQIGGAHTCACGPKSGRVRCLCVRPKKLSQPMPCYLNLLI